MYVNTAPAAPAALAPKTMIMLRYTVFSFLALIGHLRCRFGPLRVHCIFHFFSTIPCDLLRSICRCVSVTNALQEANTQHIHADLRRQGRAWTDIARLNFTVCLNTTDHHRLLQITADLSNLPQITKSNEIICNNCVIAVSEFYTVPFPAVVVFPLRWSRSVRVSVPELVVSTLQ